ncbi:uncharacterized protein LOC129962045 isoform X2 [Argiope bruennichi]|uniref:Uncharacterized protein n=2 Tax=Argiope bruennichi TaxID=94029 RepID=A0A8T0FT45_ARGBR|nr:uncharacterized protein LOC129962045 isoform X2 [Argiope bruennichi]XP_055931712.1 uncharacterized protein LOC129962045 isoform X2 [Argiope bruennichi]KAF8793936.1 hypothetical protein HNY73_001965 [Argiope bruennichi]
MHLRYWVYRRNLSNNPRSPFRSNEDIMQKAGCCISGFLGILFLGLAVMCLFSPEADKDGKLFLLFTGLFGLFEFICFIYCCIPWFCKYCCNSENEEVGDDARSSLLSSKEDVNQEVPGNQGIANYQACAGYPEVPSYQAGASYLGTPSYQAAPHSAEGVCFPGIPVFGPLANYEGVFAHQQIPIYQEDLVEPQLPPYSSKCIHHIKIPKSDIHVY